MDFWKKTNRNVKTIPKWAAGFAIGILFMGIGFRKGQFADIYHKAIMICLECIGIG